MNASKILKYSEHLFQVQVALHKYFAKFQANDIYNLPEVLSYAILDYYYLSFLLTDLRSRSFHCCSFIQNLEM